MIDAARRRKARAKAGCAQARTHKPALTHGEQSTIREWIRGERSCLHMQTNTRSLVVVKEDQGVGLEPVLSLMRLSASRQPITV